MGRVTRTRLVEVRARLGMMGETIMGEGESKKGRVDGAIGVRAQSGMLEDRGAVSCAQRK
jgi:hypothetical protein